MEAKKKKSQEQISNWILEFLLRNPSLESIAKKSLAVLPIPSGDQRLRKIVLLRTIECEISDGLVTDSTLEALELIDDLDSRRGFHSGGDAIGAAFAAVASELTVRRLVGEGGRPGPKYLAALKRIWRARLEGPGSSRRSGLLGNAGESRRRWDELEAAIWDEAACERLMGLNTRNEAVAAVKAYLKEAWVLVGKLFVGLGVKLTVNEEGLREEGEGREVVRVLRDEDEPPDKVIGLSGLGEIMKKVLDFEGFLDNGREVGDKGVALSDSDGLVADDTPVSNGKEVDKGKVVLRGKQIGTLRKRPRGPGRIDDVEFLDMDISNKDYESLPSPDVSKVQEALKSSTLDLKNAVTDPLPKAVQVAETIVSEMAPKKVVHESHLDNQSVREADSDSIAADRSGQPVKSSNANLDKPSCSHQNDVSRPNTGDADPDKPSCSRKADVSRPNLMERNSTARTFEWEEDLDDTPEANVNGKSRLHLPSPKKRLVSPLKKYEPTKLFKRRKVKRWTLLEEDTLRTGVQKFGRGNWKLILNHYRDVFEERTEVDLKDKWRNLTK